MATTDGPAASASVEPERPGIGHNAGPIWEPNDTSPLRVTDVELMDHEGRFIGVDEVLRRVPVSKVTLWRWEREKKFPARIPLTKTLNAYSLTEVLRWLQQQKDARYATRQDDGNEENEAG